MARAKVIKIPAELHKLAVALNERVVERFGPPPNYRRGGPGAAVHAGIALLEAVLSGKQVIVPAGDMRRYEASAAAAGLMGTKMALLSTLALALAMRLATAEGADDVEGRAAALVSETIRSLVEVEIMAVEGEADPNTGAALREIAQWFLGHADQLAARAGQVAETANG